jgi:GT2 family glycosyltransferase
VNTDLPTLSVVVPVYNDPDRLDRCLAALAASELAEFEVIVVDDASSDETPEVAARHGVTVIRHENRTGPGLARNTGALHARAPIVAFVDADVVVRRDTLSALAAAFDEDPDLDAVFGSYDAEPEARNFLSQYRNLLHRFFHQTGAGRASTFWAGCGAIRRKLFEEIGGFSSRFDRPSIEDIALGARLHRSGGVIRLDPAIEVTHLKRWRFWPMVVCDVVHRGIPWTLEMLRSGHIPNTLNLRMSQRLSAVITALLVATMAVAGVLRPLFLALPAAAVAGIIGIDRLVPDGTPRWLTEVVYLISAGAVVVCGLVLGSAPPAMTACLVASSLLLLAVVAINWRLYGFFLAARGLGFTLMVVPMHLLYYIYGGFAFVVGHILFRTNAEARSSA